MHRMREGPRQEHSALVRYSQNKNRSPSANEADVNDGAALAHASCCVPWSAHAHPLSD
jgi:hypothetical protein